MTIMYEAWDMLKDWFWLVCAVLLGIIAIVVLPFSMALDLFKMWRDKEEDK